eukprot:COSAG06_NODE_37799_length_431_cov_0.611446_1_plen_51_part_01
MLMACTIVSGCYAAGGRRLSCAPLPAAPFAWPRLSGTYLHLPLAVVGRGGG